MFQSSIEVQLGDGQLALFWLDRWLGSDSPCIVAPDLCTTVRARNRNRRTVKEALNAKQWIKDIEGQLTVEALRQYVSLWRIIHGMMLQPAVEDKIIWRWSAAATYSARSAYRMLFEGSTRFAGARPIWKAWAPLKVKFFVWLAVRRRIWTADRRQRHGLQNAADCNLCDQEVESPEHLFINCSYSKQVWHILLSVLCLHMPTLPTAEILEWWLQLRRGHNNLKQRGVDSLVQLVIWCLWKERNSRIFDNAPGRSISDMVHHIWSEGQLWISAGAKWLAALGWPMSASQVLAAGGIP